MQRILLLILLFFQFNSYAQETVVTGRCTDSRGKTLDLVYVASEKASPFHTYSENGGIFFLHFKNVSNAELIFKASGVNNERIRRTIQLSGEDTLDIGDVAFSFQSEDEVVIIEKAIDPFVLEPLKPMDFATLPTPGGIEKFITLTTAATSNNELTSNYNVRGGSYDENLVYVNGFNIYRPFLTRSGQQEGMSFINTALVKSIQFSAGGFNAEYGDKLSSVLDITYKTPNKQSNPFEASMMASLLGVETHVAHAPTSRFNYLVGARYRSNGYLLNTLPTKGSYNPVFWDAQTVLNYSLTEQLTWSTIGHFSSNNYRFSPETAQTDFGTANEAYSFTIYFDGQEKTRFQTMMGGTALKWESRNKKTNLDFYATVFNTDEREYFDIQGQYYINELETDPSKEEFGDSIAVLGIGSFLNHGRNRLNATIVNVYHHGQQLLAKGYKDDELTSFRSHALKWGVNFQRDEFYDILSEWKMIDSAGYSLPQNNNGSIELFETIKGELNLEAQRYTSFVQLNSIWSKNKDKIVEIHKKYKTDDGHDVVTYIDTMYKSPSRWALSLGARSGYTSSNGEFFVTPRASLKFFPRAYMVEDSTITRRNVVVRFSTGMYYQPPFYREFRTFNGELNMDVLAQKSVHVVAGSDVFFNMWGRKDPFKFTAEMYYKYLWDVNTYEIENVRTRYYANNDVVGYAYGLDLNIHGQFVEGIESFFKLGLMSTKEDVLNDSYTEYYNESGERIIFGYSEDQTVVDSAVVEPGFIPRPTDQWINFGALVQDRMPIYESFSVQMGMQFGSRLPYGPPDFQRYKDTLRMKSYFRVDIGMSYDFLYKSKHPKEGVEPKTNFWTKNFNDAIVSFEVFNLLGINNVLSKQWIQDTQGTYYSIPNYLTQRRFNLKLIVRI